MKNGKTLELRLMDAQQPRRRARARADAAAQGRDVPAHGHHRPAQRRRVDRATSRRGVPSRCWPTTATSSRGWASLHHNEVLWTRHVGEIRTIVGADYRGIKLGARLVEEMFAIAKELGLQKDHGADDGRPEGRPRDVRAHRLPSGGAARRPRRRSRKAARTTCSSCLTTSTASTTELRQTAAARPLRRRCSPMAP